MKKREVMSISVVFVMVFLVSFVCAEKLGIDIDNRYSQRGDIDFTITLYDDSNNKLEGDVDYVMRNKYTDIESEGTVRSGENVNFILPVNVEQGPWEITASYNGVDARELFNVGEYKKIDIKLDEDSLILKNIGNVIYDREVLIKIGDEDQTLRAHLERGQTKRIKLTAPVGEYTIKVDTGDEEEDLVFQGVSLTGNVVGLERIVEGNFWQKFPMVTIFLVAVVLLAVIVFVMRVRK